MSQLSLTYIYFSYRRYRCDHELDCKDGSDEADCMFTCNAEQFTCQNGDCIMDSWQCDGENDCSDGSDETESLCEKRVCPPSKFRFVFF